MSQQTCNHPIHWPLQSAEVALGRRRASWSCDRFSFPRRHCTASGTHSRQAPAPKCYHASPVDAASRAPTKGKKVNIRGFLNRKPMNRQKSCMHKHIPIRTFTRVHGHIHIEYTHTNTHVYIHTQREKCSTDGRDKETHTQRRNAPKKVETLTSKESRLVLSKNKRKAWAPRTKLRSTRLLTSVPLVSRSYGREGQKIFW